MESGGDGWVCRRGDMELSKYLGQLIEDWIADERTLSPGSAALFGDRWYCPADGSRMVDSAGCVRCPTCERCLPSRVMYMLIEFQTHLPVTLEDETRS